MSDAHFQIFEKAFWIAAKIITVLVVIGMLFPIFLLVIFVKESYDVKAEARKNLSDNVIIASDYSGWKKMKFDTIGTFQLPDAWDIQDADGLICLADENKNVIAYGVHGENRASGEENRYPTTRYKRFAEFMQDFFAMDAQTIETKTIQDIMRYNGSAVSLVSGNVDCQKKEYVRIYLRTDWDQFIWIVFLQDVGYNQNEIISIAEAIAFSHKKPSK